MKSGYDENVNKTKPFNITEHRHGKLLNRTPTYKDTFYIIYLITPRNITWQHVQGKNKNNGNSCVRYTFLY